MRAPRVETPTRVGSKAFTEGVLLGELTTQLLHARGAPAKHARELGGTRILWSALVRGDLDVYPEYSGTLREEVLAKELESGAPLAEVLAQKGIEATRPLGFENTYALGVLETTAARLGLVSIQDLAVHPELKLGLTHEFLERKDGWSRLRTVYRLPHAEPRGIEHEVAYRALAEGSVDVVDLYSTDPQITRVGIRVLTDDRHAFPEYAAVLLFRADWARANPTARQALALLEGALSLEEMRKMNAEATLERTPESSVARRFLQRKLGLGAEAAESGRVQRIWQRTREHAALVFASLFAAALIAVPLGVLCARRPRLGQGVLAVVSIVQTLPSLALLVLLLPLFGIGEWPALAALFVYSLLPMVRNTYSGIVHLPAELRESADALALPPAFKLWRIELPLASPSILAGMKTAAVLNVGTATLGALIGAGGYGQAILQGIRLDSLPTLLEGAVPAAVMALAVQGLFDLAERWVVPRGLRPRR